MGLNLDKALQVRDILEDLLKDGKVRRYGWSTDRTDAVRVFSTSPKCGVVQQQLNIFDDNPPLLSLCDEINLASINRGPLGMGILTGKCNPDTSFPEDDVRKHARWFNGLKGGHPKKEWSEKLESLRGILTSGGRTLTQGAVAWVWGRSRKTVPIPGFKTVAQVEENCKAMAFGPLAPEEMAEIERILDR